MLSIYAKYPVIYSLSERERVAVNIQGIYLSKIENSSNYHQELVSHLMPEDIEALR